jgi:hypothetical protein
MKLDYLFHRRSGALDRQEPSFSVSGRALMPVDDEPPTRESVFSGTALLDPRCMSPRQFSDWAHEMYLCRRLSWTEYRVAGFPAELHPDYNRTVGVLTGRRADPDGRRDMVQEWDETLAFARRHNDAESVEVRRAVKVLDLLRRTDRAAR